VLCVRGEDFRLGEGLSEAAEHNLTAARQWLANCLANPTPGTGASWPGIWRLRPDR
jgi:hypothetical protein